MYSLCRTSAKLMLAQILYTNLIVLFLPLLPHHQRLPTLSKTHHTFLTVALLSTSTLASAKNTFNASVHPPSCLSTTSSLLISHNESYLSNTWGFTNGMPTTGPTLTSFTAVLSTKTSSVRLPLAYSSRYQFPLFVRFAHCASLSLSRLNSVYRAQATSALSCLASKYNIHVPQEYIDQERDGADTNSRGVRCGWNGRCGSDCHDLNERGKKNV
jgi:hypothetical protein